MDKKGQITLFVILGIVIAVSLILFLYARQTIFFKGTPENLNEIANEIEEHIIECINDVGGEPLIMIGLQGGYLNPGEDTYRLYNDTRISYLCYDIPEKSECRNRMLLVGDMEKQLDDALKPRVLSCVGIINKFRGIKPVKIEATGEFKLNTKINIRDVEVVVDYPIVVSSKDNVNSVSRNNFAKRFNYPLGDLYNVMHDIIDSETAVGEFDQLLYMIAKKAEYKIYKNRPYPDRLYVAKRSDNDYQFQFFVQGEPG